MDHRLSDSIMRPLMATRPFGDQAGGVGAIAREAVRESNVPLFEYGTE
jgi:hypothetical protein